MPTRRTALACLTVLVVALAACGGPHGQTATESRPAGEFPATRWIPATPTYLVAARTVRDAQRAVVDVVDTVGMMAGVSPADASRALERLLAVDVLSPDPVAAIGVDLAGGIAVFSDEVSPTLVVHLAAPEATQSFFERLRHQGMVTRSVIVDGAEVFTAQLVADVNVSWAVDHDWLWVHFGLPVAGDDGPGWFARSHHPAASGWASAWTWATQLAAHAPVVGFVDPRGVMTRLSAAAACVQLVQPLGRVAISVDADSRHVGAKLAIELGASASSIVAGLLPPPAGWATTASHAPVAAQWNLDLAAVARWLAPCAVAMGQDGRLASIGEVGVRAARAVVLAISPDDNWGSGAIALELSSRRYFAKLLDEIPMRSHFESDRAFGSYPGHRISIPFKGKIDYVLDDRVALFALGEGVLDGLVTGAAPAAIPVLAIDLQPTAMPQAAWAWLFARAGASGPRAAAIAARLVTWRDVHFAARVEAGKLVVEAAGNRR